MDTGANAEELRKAASNARSFARTLKSGEVMDGFLALARRWDAEADAMEIGYIGTIKRVVTQGE